MPGEEAAARVPGGVRQNMKETPKRQTLEEFGREIFDPEFLKECDDEYRRMEIVGSKRDREWTDSRLPGWTFYRSDYCETLFVGCNNDIGLTVQGSSVSEVQEAAAEAEEMLATEGADAER